MAEKKHSLPNAFCGYCGGHRDFAGALVHALDCPKDIGETRRALGSAWTQLVELVERLEEDLREANRRGDAWRDEVAGAVRERDAALERLRAVEAEFHVAMAEARAEFVDAVRPRADKDRSLSG